MNFAASFLLFLFPCFAFVITAADPINATAETTSVSFEDDDENHDVDIMMLLTSVCEGAGFLSITPEEVVFTAAALETSFGDVKTPLDGSYLSDVTLINTFFYESAPNDNMGLRNFGRTENKKPSHHFGEQFHGGYNCHICPLRDSMDLGHEESVWHKQWEATFLSKLQQSVHRKFQSLTHCTIKMVPIPNYADA